jgi:hypothetical protein
VWGKGVVLAFGVSALATAVLAAPWAIVTSATDRVILTVDLGSNPPAVYGPFSPAPFVLTAGLGGVAIAPGGRLAVVKNSGGPMYLIDVTHPRTPFPVATINTREFGSDLAISGNGRFAIPTFEVLFVVVDLLSQTLSGRILVDPPLVNPGCVAISPDDSTVVFCDASNHALFVGRLNGGATDLESAASIAAGESRNALFASNATILVGNADDSVSVFELTAPGNLAPGSISSLVGFPGAQESLAAHPNGRLVAVLSTRPSPDRVSFLEVTGPGTAARLNGDVDLVSDADATSGVERMAFTPNGDRLVIGSTIAPQLTVVDVATRAVSVVSTNGQIPYGIALFQGPSEPSEPIPALSPAALLVMVLALAAVGVLAARASGIG